MKVSISWLKELVEINTPIDQLAKQLNSKIQGGVKEVTDDYIELDLKGYNRADLLSLRGVALEVAALIGVKTAFKESAESKFPWVRQEISSTPVKVETQQNCPFYCIARIEGLRVDKSSPDWVKKLTDSGMRSINNVADVTNLVMLEYGQPTHAFDADRVKDQTLIVRMANTGEELITLDNKKRVLESTDIVIADPEKAVGLAGVMGGKDSEVVDSTTTILLEAAIFNSAAIKKTASRLGLPSEAGKRFQHGLTKTRLLQAVDAAVKMYEGLGGKLTAITIIDNSREQVHEIEVSHQKLNSLIGIDIKPEEIEKYLQKLHFKIIPHLPGENHDDTSFHLEGGRTKTWKVTPPYWRLDVEIEADIIEEIARIYGYENIPPKELQGKEPQKIDQSIFELISNLKTALVKFGLDEIQTYSFYSTQVLKSFDITTKRLLKIANPMSKETEYLKENNWPNLVEIVVKNIKQGFENIAIFEVGKIYYINEKEQPAEKYSLSIALVNGSDNPLAELYQIFNKLNKELNLKIKEVESETKLELFHPNRFIQLSYGEKMVGGLAEVHKRITDRLGINQRVAVLEIGITKLL